MSSSSMSPNWIAGAGTNSRLRVDHFNLWPSTSVSATSTAAATWAAYSSALATLTLNQINEAKFPHHRGPSPLTPTTPTYAPDSPSSISGHPDIQPDSPHSVDYHPDSYADYPADPADYCLTTSLQHNRKQKRCQSTTVVPYPPSKKKKSFTIDSILGLDSEQQQPSYFARDKSRAEETLPECRVSEPSTSPVTNPSASPSATCLSSNSTSPRTKRVRTIFSAEQLERLEAEFARQQYMVGPERLLLAASLRLTESQVKVWFQNRRIKWRKQHLEAQQMRLVSWRQQHGPAGSDDEQSESYSD